MILSVRLERAEGPVVVSAPVAALPAASVIVAAGAKRTRPGRPAAIGAAADPAQVPATVAVTVAPATPSVLAPNDALVLFSPT